MNKQLTHLEAFKSMHCFLEKYYEQTSSDEIGVLLGEMRLLEDNSTADPAVWEDWIICIEKTLAD